MFVEEMNDNLGKTASSSAITEKKPQRAGGCTGIFFQLFDWNRRFAKKKFFSKKLLPPVRSRQNSKKFGGDDKQPKLRLIADENSGGFPNVKNGPTVVDHGHKHGMRAPSLVAKLMGLESMPAIHRNKSRKGLPGPGSDRTEKSVNECKKFERKELISDQAEVKNEWRPQKLQRTGLSERRPVAKFGAEALQIKSVLSRSKKHQLPKLGSPVKSPKSSGRNSSRLIGAATRILEPGLQKSRARCALTYSNTSTSHPNYKTALEERIDFPSEQMCNSSFHNITAVMPPKGQSLCSNCGHTFDVLGSRSMAVERPSNFGSPVSHYVESCGQGCEMSKPRKFIVYQGPEEDKKIDESAFGSASQSDIEKNCYEPTSSWNPLDKEDQVKYQSTSQQYKSQKDSIPFASPKHKTPVPSQMLQVKDRYPAKPKLSSPQRSRVSLEASANSETRNFVALNQRLSGHARSRMPSKVDNWKLEVERKSGIRRKDSLTSVQKKRPTYSHPPYESSGSLSNCFSQQFITEMESKFTDVSINRPRTKSTLSQLGGNSKTVAGVEKGTDALSLTFNSRVKFKMESHREVEDCKIQIKSSSENNIENHQRPFPRKALSLSGDALSSLLEEKLKELSSQDEDEFSRSGTAPKKTTTMILHELISALTTEQHIHDDLTAQSNSKLDPYHHHHESMADTSFQFKAKPTSPTSFMHDNDDNRRLSPGSVLEASFSVDSCPSSSLDDISIPGNRLMLESVGCFHDELSTLEADGDVLDSAISERVKSSRQIANRLLNNVSEALSSINVTGTSLKGFKLNHAKDVILNAEVMLGNSATPSLHVNGGCTISHFLIAELDTLARIIWTSFSYTRVWNQLEGFTFDSIIEYLDAKYTRYSKCGFSAWSRLPPHEDSKMIIQDIVEVIRRWAELAGMKPDDLIEWDMSHSLGKWTDFEVEGFETGVELDVYLLQVLIDEIVIDLWESC